MRNEVDCQQVRLIRRFWWGMLVWLAIALGPATTMASWNNKFREEAVQQLYAEYKKCFPEVPDISPSEAMKLVQEGQAVFIDIRPPLERRVSRLPGAIAKKDFLNCINSYQEKIVIAYDTIGYRSGLEVRRLRAKGLNLINLQGGMLAWLHAGGKVYDDNGETRRVHVYGSLWNYAPIDCETVR